MEANLINHMNYIINHNRKFCSASYIKLSETDHQFINNTDCILLGVKNTGPLRDHDKTFNDNTWLENSADLLGIKHDIAVSTKTIENFVYTDKIPLTYELLKRTTYEYAIIADTIDSVIVKNPDSIVNVLRHYDCDIVYSTTRWPGHDEYTMPDKHKFIQSLYGGNLFLNSGVSGGKVSSLIKLYERILDYAGYELTIDVFHQMYNKHNGYIDWSMERLKTFPNGVACDQSIIRFLFQEFYPSIKLDTDYLLAAPR